MKGQFQETTVLEDGNHVAVIGGGPAGSFFAIHLLREAKQRNRHIDVTLIEKKALWEPTPAQRPARACNYCAGAISPRLHARLERIGILIPDQLTGQVFSHIWIHGSWKNFPLRILPEQKMYSVFRGTLPDDRNAPSGGFDHFILKTALEAGARAIAGEVLGIRQTPSAKPILTIKAAKGEQYTLETDFAVIATGVNVCPGKPHRESELFKSYRKINPRFIPPETRRALIFELKPGRDYLKKYMDREIYFIISGSGKLMFDHIALVPKGEYLTVALVGDCVDRASLPRETAKLRDIFLSLRPIRNILPQITSQTPPLSCTCYPNLAFGASKAPFGHRTAVIGDAAGARLYWDGLFSAFVAAQALAETAMTRGIDKRSLSNGYGPMVEWLARDIRYGKMVFKSMELAFGSPFLSRVMYQAFATEMKFKKMADWPLGNLLRKIGSGASDYEEVFHELLSARVARSVLTGVLKTARNILTEAFLGVKWREYGRYPTVIVKEKRDHFKRSIEAPLGITLDAAPEMERMYAIKIRASAAEIFEELGKFGDVQGKFLRLRFVDVRRISGLPNQVGTVIRYRLRALPASMDIRLSRCIPGKVLLYEPGELFAKGGKLIFDITPTQDGNQRLVIYTAFDFRRGRGMIGRGFWRLFKRLFPEYAHDVVWNHAICCIKGEVERRAIAA